MYVRIYNRDSGLCFRQSWVKLETNKLNPRARIDESIKYYSVELQRERCISEISQYS